MKWPSFLRLPSFLVKRELVDRQEMFDRDHDVLERRTEDIRRRKFILRAQRRAMERRKR